MAQELTPSLKLAFEVAQEPDAAELAALHTAVARDLTQRYGRGNWSYETSERGARSAIKSARVVVARQAGVIVGRLHLQTKKPWAIDRAYFTRVPRPLYLTNMAVIPAWQRRGVGRRLLEEALAIAEAWPAQSVCLDAYDAAAGAGPFYANCGFTEVGRAAYRGTPLIYYERLVNAPWPGGLP